MVVPHNNYDGVVLVVRFDRCSCCIMIPMMLAIVVVVVWLVVVLVGSNT